MTGLSDEDRESLEDLWTREDMGWLPAVEAIVQRAVAQALTEAADRLERLGNEISRYDDDPVTVMAWRTYADSADLVRIRIPN